MKRIIFLGLCILLFPYLCLAGDPQAELERLATEGDGVIRLSHATFDMLTSPQRTWSASVHLTALDPKRRCHPCTQFDPAWRTVAKAWSRAPAVQRNQHFFATIDFDEVPGVFQQLGLASAPVVLSYPPASGDRKPTGGKTSPIKYDFSDGFDAGPLAEVISKFTPIPVPYKVPIDWLRITVIAIGVLGAVFLMRFVSPIVQNRWSWAIFTVLTILVMTSGFMFVRIRGLPYADGNGQWVAAGYSNQYGQEVHVVAFIYGLLSLAFLMLIMVVPTQSSSHRQRLQIYLWTGIIMIMYSVLVSLFRLKNRGYPFKLFL